MHKTWFQTALLWFCFMFFCFFAFFKIKLMQNSLKIYIYWIIILHFRNAVFCLISLLWWYKRIDFEVDSSLIHTIHSDIKVLLTLVLFKQNHGSFQYSIIWWIWRRWHCGPIILIFLLTATRSCESSDNVMRVRKSLQYLVAYIMELCFL